MGLEIIDHDGARGIDIAPISARITLPVLMEGSESTSIRNGADHLFIDDGPQRIKVIIEQALTNLTLVADDFSQDSKAQALSWLACRDHAHQFAMGIAFQRLSLLNAHNDRAKVDAMLASLRERILRFATDCSSHDIAIFRHDRGFYLLAETLRDRHKWNWMAEEIVTMLHDNSLLDDSAVSIGAQIALASRKESETPEQLLGRLDAGMDGLFGDVSVLIKWVDRGSDLPPPREANLENDLARAIDREEIIVRFQPQFAMANGHLTGVEALARWQHPELGELGAATLFAVAGRAEMVQPVSDYIQRKALQHAAAWPEALSDVRLSVNLTAQDLAIPGFADSMIETVHSSGFDAARLTVEITETALISDLKRASRLCEKLRETHMRVAIDDFGTGYSSLLYLKSLPLDYLKIDGAISRDIEGSPRDQTIVRSIIALGLALDLEVIAEGVENVAQRDHLAEEGCHYYQGFLGGEALDNADFITFAMRAN
ncbi:EAL domain-containing protein [Alterisphingorhabdus coralli]|uniref:EAL domain-containing protein n=1 Tax=Alterisphingorhabdus coralli TaxID=3071408 RepID=A0AA97F4D9_9SPHN|nr:EAL domain-containing protein [Parasphingorhabdus sp. SCSIO 66989]WOE74114.1 EAL domain-containing protein [Parasphingorhabdus sp. SCSIO 66989]